MIKKLDILLIRSFIGPFILTFFITLFVLVMQFFWLYMDELIGKGLGSWMIIQLLFYMSTTLVPMALPLGILLASIMTFGSMGEHFELVAIKSAGISLIRFMRPLVLFIMAIGVFAFVFNNRVIPYANLKALSLLYDLRNSKPALNIRPGQFNTDIDGYAIRVGEKGEDGQSIRHILIYDHSSGLGNDHTIVAEKGIMFPSPDKKNLIFRLENGWRYEEKIKYTDQRIFQQTRMQFRQWDKVFDLSSFGLSRTNEDLFKDAHQMMDIQQLNERIDSMGKYQHRLVQNVYSYLGPYLSLMRPGTDSAWQAARTRTPEPRSYENGFLDLVEESRHPEIRSQVYNQARNIHALLDITAFDQKLNLENSRKYNIEWHRKFTLSFACLLLFLIGAPLGAIIQKGGIGMPLVIAVAFFIIFHIMSITGEKLAKAGSLAPWMGMWMATAMLLPIAFILIQQARNDSKVFSKEWYLRWANRILGIFITRKADAK